MNAGGHGCAVENVTTLGAIGSGFAHEIGNPIAGALAVVQLAARRTREPETRERLASVHGELIRAARIVRELADFTRLQGPAAVIDVNEVAQAALTLARYAHQHVPLTVVFEPSPRVLPIVGDRSALLHVLLHLTMHAYATADPGSDRLRLFSALHGAENLVVVERTGHDGLDLALATCGFIVTAHLGGTVAVEVMAGGSRATLRLPVTLPSESTPLA